jgi:hypothetical protein
MYETFAVTVPKNAAGVRPKFEATYTCRAVFYRTLGEISGFEITSKLCDTANYENKKLAIYG